MFTCENCIHFVHHVGQRKFVIGKQWQKFIVLSMILLTFVDSGNFSIRFFWRQYVSLFALIAAIVVPICWNLVFFCTYFITLLKFVLNIYLTTKSARKKVWHVHGGNKSSSHLPEFYCLGWGSKCPPINQTRSLHYTSVVLCASTALLPATLTEKVTVPSSRLFFKELQAIKTSAANYLT